MKIILLLLTGFFFSSFSSSYDKTVIIQPYTGISASSCIYVKARLEHIIPNVVVRKSIPLPKSAYTKARGRYIAASLLKTYKAGGRTMLITNSDISYKDRGVIGLSFCPGKVGIVSTFRLSKTNTSEQLFKAVLHELGHTEGLPHCPSKTCFMRAGKGKNNTNATTQFCPTCKSFLTRRGWNLK